MNIYIQQEGDGWLTLDVGQKLHSLKNKNNNVKPCDIDINTLQIYQFISNY